MRQPHTRLRRGDCAPPPFPQTPELVRSCDPLHHSRFAGELTQCVAFQMLRTARPITQRASNPLSRCVLHSSCREFAARAQPHGNPGRLREAQDCWIAHSPRGSERLDGRGCALRCRYAFPRLRTRIGQEKVLGDAERPSPLSTQALHSTTAARRFARRGGRGMIFAARPTGNAWAAFYSSLCAPKISDPLRE